MPLTNHEELPTRDWSISPPIYYNGYDLLLIPSTSVERRQAFLHPVSGRLPEFTDVKQMYYVDHLSQHDILCCAIVFDATITDTLAMIVSGIQNGTICMCVSNNYRRRHGNGPSKSIVLSIRRFKTDGKTIEIPTFKEVDAAIDFADDNMYDIDEYRAHDCE